MTGYLDTATMGLHQPFGDRKAEAQTARALTREPLEAVEQLLEIFLGYSGPLITHENSAVTALNSPLGLILVLCSCSLPASILAASRRSSANR
jgi:hypothetical protein